MIRKLRTIRPPHSPARVDAEARSADADLIETTQLKRLASTLLEKSPADLAAIAEDNPQIVWEWIEEFARRKAAAQAEARLWNSAMTWLAANSPDCLPEAAE